jgi:hypothetical protein
MIKKAIFIGDCYRPEQKGNVDALLHIFLPICKAFGIEIKKYITEHNKSVLDKSTLFVWQKSLIEQRESDLCKFNLEKTIVFAFEISNVDKKYLNKIGVPWLSYSIHPLRFLDDLYLDIQTNLKLDFSIFYASHARIEMCIQALHSRYRLKLSQNSHKSLCIIGQTPFDKSVFIDGEFKSLKNYSKKIDEICKSYNKIYYRPHPHLSCNENDKFIRDKYKTTDVKISNLYAFLIANPNMSVCAISSSVLNEAIYFGNKVYKLETITKNNSQPIDYRKLICDNKLWQSIFKRNSFGQHNDLKEVIPKNFLRNFFNSWSFQSEINDVINDINYLTSKEYTKISQFNDLKNIFNDSCYKFTLFDEKLNKFSFELNSVSSEIIKTSQTTKKILQESKMISEDAKIISEGARIDSAECRKLSARALKQVDTSNDIAKMSLTTANESISKSLNALEHIEDFQTEFKQIRSKLIWYLLKSYGKFEKYIFNKISKYGHK